VLVLKAAGLDIGEADAAATAVERGDARGQFHGMPVDLFFDSIPRHEAAATRTREVVLHGTRVRVLSPEDTAVFKLLFFRGKDWLTSSGCSASPAPGWTGATCGAGWSTRWAKTTSAFASGMS